MAARLNVKVEVTVTDAADGSGFAKNVVELANVPYEGFVSLEKAVAAALTSVASNEVERKKNKNK